MSISRHPIPHSPTNSRLSPLRSGQGRSIDCALSRRGVFRIGRPATALQILWRHCPHQCLRGRSCGKPLADTIETRSSAPKAPKVTVTMSAPSTYSLSKPYTFYTHFHGGVTASYNRVCRPRDRRGAGIRSQDTKCHVAYPSRARGDRHER
jgi:hypothetical protein